MEFPPCGGPERAQQRDTTPTPDPSTVGSPMGLAKVALGIQCLLTDRICLKPWQDTYCSLLPWAHTF